MTEYALTDADGTVRWRGTIDPPPGGGSQPGVLCSADLLFTEQATVGTYTATLDVEAGTVVLDVLVYFLSWPWADPNMDNVVLTVGDSGVPGAYYDGLGLTNIPHDTYDPATLNPSMWLLLSGQNGGTCAGLAYSCDPNGNIASGPGYRYATADTITATIAPTGASGTGIILLKILYLAPVTAENAVFA